MEVKTNIVRWQSGFCQDSTTKESVCFSWNYNCNNLNLQENLLKITHLTITIFFVKNLLHTLWCFRHRYLHCVIYFFRLCSAMIRSQWAPKTPRSLEFWNTCVAFGFHGHCAACRRPSSWAFRCVHVWRNTTWSFCGLFIWYIRIAVCRHHVFFEWSVGCSLCNTWASSIFKKQKSNYV